MPSILKTRSKHVKLKNKGKRAVRAQNKGSYAIVPSTTIELVVDENALACIGSTSACCRWMVAKHALTDRIDLLFDLFHQDPLTTIRSGTPIKGAFFFKKPVKGGND